MAPPGDETAWEDLEITVFNYPVDGPAFEDDSSVRAMSLDEFVQRMDVTFDAPDCLWRATPSLRVDTVPYFEDLLLSWLDFHMPRLRGLPPHLVAKRCFDGIPEVLLAATEWNSTEPLALERGDYSWELALLLAVNHARLRPEARARAWDFVGPSMVAEWVENGRERMSSDEQAGAAWLYLITGLLVAHSEDPLAHSRTPEKLMSMAQAALEFRLPRQRSE